MNAPSITLSLSPSTITDGQSSTLSWSTSRITACSASGAWTGATALSGTQPVTPSAGSYTYTLTCTGTGGASVSKSVTLTVNASSALQAAPSVTLSVSPTSTSPGGPVQLTWSTTHATTCTASGSWSGDRELSGTESITAPTAAGTYSYTLSCDGSGGSGSATATLSVPSSGSIICSPPTVSISVSPTGITEGQSSTLTWSATPGACGHPSFVSCTASGAWSGAVATSGSQTLSPSAGSFTYVLSCSGPNATVTQSATLTVASAGAPISAPVVNLSLSPPNINLGESSTLTWSTSYARSCTASGAWSGSVGLGGSTSVAPSATGTYGYTLTCLNSYGTTAKTATLSVEVAAGTTSTARFGHPRALAVDGNGNVFVADTDNNVIRKIAPTNAVTVFAGDGGASGNDGIGIGATFWAPAGLTVDGSGNFYVGDTGNDAVRAMTPTATVTTLAGLAGSAGSADNTGAAARFNQPYGVATDSAGNVYVADMNNDTVRKVTPAGAVTTIAGTAGAAGSADGTGAAARFWGPMGVAVDSAGNIYVADTSNSTIRKIVCSPSCAATTFAGQAGVPGNTDGTGTGAQFTNPVGLAVDSAGNLYVADPPADTIRKVTPAGVVTTFAGLAGSAGSLDATGSSARFSFPIGIATDASDNVYVADTNNCTIRKITPAAAVTTIAGQVGVCGSSN